MGIGSSGENADADSPARAFSKDVLSFAMEGPDRPRLTVVDVPGLIQNAAKGISERNKDTVAETTDFTQASDDYADQPVLTKVRAVDPEGNRTLGVIMKRDRLPPGSGIGEACIPLARNEDVFFKLGWHVV
ncbi:hypothetical protein D0865_12985 [Hortaea werneckii]|uniref:Dynamin N-terminal domain-containing protein n=1 Tax=Hortaea werneckii TaxID=91943 RepID=A0A3M7BGB8_HORWE|nr:hypothetical protein D0865_12985 [Hortaea werneckii]